MNFRHRMSEDGTRPSPLQKALLERGLHIPLHKMEMIKHSEMFRFELKTKLIRKY